MRPVAWVRRRLDGAGPGERGSAVVEFLGVSLLLLVPLVYLIVTLGRVQAAGFAAEGAAREAGRLIVQAETIEQGVARARLAVELAFADHGMEVDGAEVLTLTCEEDPCLTPGAYIHVGVESSVGLPGAPAFMASVLPTRVTVAAEAMAAVGDFREAP